MLRFRFAILLFGLSGLLSCSAPIERPEEAAEARRAREEREQRPSSMPTFEYRPGAGLTIEGR
jgi:hypothetical protein